MAAEASRAPDVREQRTAPRIPPHPTSMAATAARSFDISEFDEALMVLGELRAIAELLSAGFDDAQKVSDICADAPELLLRRPSTYSRAMDGLERMAGRAGLHINAGMGVRS